MKITIQLTKDDIHTLKVGFHYEIRTKSGFAINFDEESFEELENDIKEIRRVEQLINEDRAIND